MVHAKLIVSDIYIITVYITTLGLYPIGSRKSLLIIAKKFIGCAYEKTRRTEIMNLKTEDTTIKWFSCSFSGKTGQPSQFRERNMDRNPGIKTYKFPLASITGLGFLYALLEENGALKDQRNCNVIFSRELRLPNRYFYFFVV